MRRFEVEASVSHLLRVVLLKFGQNRVSRGDMCTIFCWTILRQLAVQRNGFFSDALEGHFEGTLSRLSSSVHIDGGLRIRSSESLRNPIGPRPVNGSGVAALDGERKRGVGVNRQEGLYFLEFRSLALRACGSNVLICTALAGGHDEPECATDRSVLTRAICALRFAIPSSVTYLHNSHVRPLCWV